MTSALTGKPHAIETHGDFSEVLIGQFNAGVVNTNILVTGGTGFIGSRLVHRLVATGANVHVLLRETSDTASLDGVLDKVKRVYGDITKRSSLAGAFEVDQVYHTAGITYMGDKRNDQLYAINVEGVQNVLDAAVEAGVKRVVHVSSVSAIGISEGGVPLDETAEWNFDRIGLEYARTKHLAEKAVADAVARGLDCVIVNPAYVFGAGDVNFNAGRLIKDVYRRKLPFYPLGGVCVVDVEIVTETMIAAMQKGRTGERYIIGGDNVSFRELAATIAAVTGAPGVYIPMPFWIAQIVKAILNLNKEWDGMSKLFNLSMFRVASEFLYFDSSKAARELGMRREPHEESVRRAFEWYKERDML